MSREIWIKVIKTNLFLKEQFQLSSTVKTIKEYVAKIVSATNLKKIILTHNNYYLKDEQQISSIWGPNETNVTIRAYVSKSIPGEKIIEINTKKIVQKDFAYQEEFNSIMKLFFTAFNSVQGVCSESDALNSLGYTKEKLQYANFLTKSGWRSTALLVNDFITDENIQLIKVLMDSETTLYEKVSACAKLVNSAVEHGLISKFYAYSFVPSITMFYCKSEEQHTGSEYKNPFRLAYENMPHLIQDVSFQKAIFYDEEKCKYLSSIVTNPQKFIMLPKAVEILESTGDVALASQIL